MDAEPQLALLWIHSAHEAACATRELLAEIAPRWEFVMNTGHGVDLMYGAPGYAQAMRAAKDAWLNPSPGQLERDLQEQADALAQQETPAERAAANALPLPWHEYEALYDAHQALCEASARKRRPTMRLSGEYLHLQAGSGPDLLLRNENQDTLEALLLSCWQPVAYGQSSLYAIAPARDGGLAQWLRRANWQPGQPSLLRQFLHDRNTPAAPGLDIFCQDNLPDWDCGMGMLMLFATPALARTHMQRLRHDPRVHWWPDLASADARWRRPDWPPSQRVQLCPFDLCKDRIWEGNEQVCLLPSAG